MWRVGGQIVTNHPPAELQAAVQERASKLEKIAFIEQSAHSSTGAWRPSTLNIVLPRRWSQSEHLCFSVSPEGLNMVGCEVIDRLCSKSLRDVGWRKMDNPPANEAYASIQLDFSGRMQHLSILRPRRRRSSFVDV